MSKWTWHASEMKSWFYLIFDNVAANAHNDERKGHLPGNNYIRNTGRQHRFFFIDCLQICTMTLKHNMAFHTILFWTTSKNTNESNKILTWYFLPVVYIRPCNKNKFEKISLGHSFLVRRKTFQYIYIYIYIYTQPLCTRRMRHKVNFQLSLTGLNSKFFYSLIACHTKVRVQSTLLFYPHLEGE